MKADTIEMCRNIANSMRDPQQIVAFVDRHIGHKTFSIDEWPKLSFAYGFPGIACFYSTMDQLLPNEGWDQIAYDYLQLTVRTLEEEGSPDSSLYFGMAGICFAAYLSSQNGERYQQLLSQLDTILVEEIERSFFPQVDKCCAFDLHLPPFLYNLLQGASGCLAYLTLRKDELWLNKMALRLLTTIVQGLSRSRMIQGKSVPGWYVSPDDYFTLEENNQSPNGSFCLSTTFGITGVLSALSIASNNGYTVPGQLELIRQIAYWLKSKQKTSPEGIVWEDTSSFEDECDPSHKLKSVTRDIWDHGIPAVARSLYLASQALHDQTLGQYAEDSFEKLFQKPSIEWNHIATPISYGRAGILSLTDRMAKDTGNHFLAQQAQQLEADLKRFYDPQHCFGFQMAAYDESREPPFRWVDSPCLYDGSAGIALSLLSLDSEKFLEWQRAFVIA